MSESQSLEAYLGRRFESPDPKTTIPAPAQAHIDWWRRGPASRDATAVDLVTDIAQFRIDVAEGASDSSRYRRLIRETQVPGPDDVATEPVFIDPDGVETDIHEHAAGPLPVVACRERIDFERCFRTLAGRCEPIDVPKAVHALYLAGLPNPARTREIQEAWLASGGLDPDWPAEARARRTADPTTFHDQLILVHDAPYAGLAAPEVDSSYSERDWLERSRILRLEHEFTHHTTHRLLGSYRLHVLDELYADFMGFTKAMGRFDARVFLAGLGIRNDEVANDGRLWTYVRDLDRSGIGELVDITARCAANLEAIAPGFITDERTRLRRLLLLARANMQELGEAGWPDRFSARLDQLDRDV